MRVLFVTPSYPPASGGAERMLFELVQALRQQGVSVRVLTTSPSDEAEPDVVRLRKRRTFYRQDTILPTAVAAEIGSFRPHIVQTSGPNPTELFALAASRIARVLCVSLYHADFDLRKPLALGYTVAHSILMRGFARVVVTTQRMRRSLIRRMIEPSRIRVIPPGIAIAADPTNGRRANVLFVGGLDTPHRYKRLDLLLRAIAIPTVEATVPMLIVVGDGDLRPAMQTLAVRLGIADRVSFLGRLSDAALQEQYASAKTLVLPSPTFQEGFGIVAIEALASGARSIISAAAGAAEVIERYGGMIVPPYDVTALGAAIARSQDAPSLGMEESNRVRLDFSWPAIATRWIKEVYEGLGVDAG